MELRDPPKPRPGDRVAIVSPSSGLPGLFPQPYELGLQRLRDELGLVPVEYPTTRRMDSTPEDRAADLNAAFADPSIKAVITTIGGGDQIRVLPHLDRELIAAHPKPFFGYSDNTNLLLRLSEPTESATSTCPGRTRRRSNGNGRSNPRRTMANTEIRDADAYLGYVLAIEP